MSISNMHMRLIAREHRRRPFTGSVLQLGRQRFLTDYDGARRALEAEGVKPMPLPSDLLLHGVRPGGLADDSPDHITDIAFFAMLGLTEVKALDFSLVDNPEFHVDLNDPVPPELHGQFDLIVDGGSFDHLFDLKQAFINVAQMLKPGGRIIQWNAASNYVEYGAYCSFSPSLYLDYYEGNGFTNCQSFVAVRRRFGAEEWELFQYERAGNSETPFLDPRPVIAFVWAEKTESSTVDKVPTQGHWHDSPPAPPEPTATPPVSLRTRGSLLRRRHPRLMAGPLVLWRILQTLRAAPSWRIVVDPKRHPSSYRYLGKF